MRVFTITIVGYEGSSTRILQSPKDLSDSEFQALVGKLKEEQWELIIKDPEITYATEPNLVDNIVKVLVERDRFVDLNPPEYLIREFSYEKQVEGILIQVKTNGREETIALL